MQPKSEARCRFVTEPNAVDHVELLELHERPGRRILPVGQSSTGFIRPLGTVMGSLAACWLQEKLRRGTTEDL